MAQQKSEDRVVPDGGVMPAQPADDGQGKAIPVDQQARQLCLPIATAEHREGVPDRSGTDRVAVEPKAIVNVELVAPVTMEEVAYRLTDALEKVVLNKERPARMGRRSRCCASGGRPPVRSWPGACWRGAIALACSPGDDPEGGWRAARVGDSERDRSCGVRGGQADDRACLGADFPCVESRVQAGTELPHGDR